MVLIITQSNLIYVMTTTSSTCARLFKCLNNVSSITHTQGSKKIAPPSKPLRSKKNLGKKKKLATKRSRP